MLLFTYAMELSAVIKQEDSSEVTLVNQTISNGSVGERGSLGQTWDAMLACLIAETRTQGPGLEFCLALLLSSQATGQDTYFPLNLRCLGCEIG